MGLGFGLGSGLGFTWSAAAAPRGRPVLTLTGATPCVQTQPTEPVSLPSRQPPLPPRPPHLLTTQLTSHQLSHLPCAALSPPRSGLLAVHVPFGSITSSSSSSSSSCCCCGAAAEGLHSSLSSAARGIGAASCTWSAAPWPSSASSMWSTSGSCGVAVECLSRPGAEPWSWSSTGTTPR